MNRLVAEVLWWAIQHRIDRLVALIYRRYCPGSGNLARDCIAAGNCGCNNAPPGYRPGTATGECPND